MYSNKIGFVGGVLALAVSTLSSHAQNIFTPGDILVSSSTYAGTASTVTIGQALPGGGVAVANGTYGGTTPNVFNNEGPDPSFGVTSPISIRQLTPAGVDTGVRVDIDTNALTTSFPSKSELALNLSSDGTAITFMGYPAPVNTLDVSNSNTPGVFDSTNPVSSSYYRVIAQLNYDGTITYTSTNAYSGNNGRAAYLASNGQYYTVGNAGNGSSPANTSISNPASTGVQSITPGSIPVTPVNSTAGLSTSLGSYISTYDNKPGKDNNFRGLTIYNNTVYISKGSGSNGVNTVYQVGMAGILPTGNNNTISILPGFSTISAKSGTNPTHPFGLWFANSTTLYVADEGTGSTADFGKSANAAAGLGKWILVGGTWQLAYTLKNNLNIGANYVVSGTNGGVSGSYTTATDGLRNITGKVNADGTVTIYAITSTASSNTDAGADPNQLVSINDTLANTTDPGTAESFTTLQTAAYGQVLRGVSFVPQALPTTDTPTMPLFALVILGFILLVVGSRILPASMRRA